MEKTPDQWIKKLETITLEAKEIPMWGSPPEFPWDEFSKSLESSINLEKFSISPKNADWQEESTFLEGMGSNPIIIGIDCQPLTGPIHFIIPLEEVSKLSSWVLSPERSKQGFEDANLQKGFCQFLALEALSVIDDLQIYPDLAPKITSKPLPNAPCYVVQIAIKYKRKTLLGKLILSPSFQQSFKTHFQNQPIDSEKLFEDIDAKLHLETGYTELSQSDWDGVKVGDFIILDSCRYHPNTKKGIMQLSYLNTPLFQVKLKDEQIKILDYAVYIEDRHMADDEIEELPTPSEEEQMGLAEEEKEESIEEEDELPEELLEELPEIQKPDELVAPKNIPLTITVEVTRIKMSLKTLKELKPGNVIDLPVSPEQGVSLTISGKSVARGQLLQIGDILGVKLTEIGS